MKVGDEGNDSDLFETTTPQFTSGAFVTTKEGWALTYFILPLEYILHYKK